MKIVKGSFAFAVVMLLAGAAQAATVTYTLYRGFSAPGVITPGNFVLTAKVDPAGDNGGLSGYGIDLAGVITALDHKSPRDPSATSPTQEGPTGFTLGRSADNVVPSHILGSQDINNPDAILVYGFGNQNSSFAEKNIVVGGTTLEQADWDAELILATGQFTGLASTLLMVQGGPNAGANVFVAGTGSAVRAPETLSYVTVDVPEPATVGMLGMIGVVAALRRRLFA